jgi:hypothetical protein
VIHKELKIYYKFKIEEEPNSLFYKETNKYNGSINSYKIKDEYKDKMLEPVYFAKNYKVIKSES